MGALNAIVGLGSAIFGGITSSNAADQAAEQALTGYNYLTDNELVNASQTQGLEAQNAIAALLGLGGDPAAAEQAFQQYQDSTGYQFRLNEGMSAITGSAAARGLLNSGATAKGLTQYGQDLATQEFNNYLNQLLGQQASGLTSAYTTGQAGTAGGGTAGGYTYQGAQDTIANVAGGLGYALDPYM